MNGLAALRDNLYGAWQIMLGRPTGLAHLDVSLEGFWRSFAAIILVAPFAFLALISEGPLLSGTGETGALTASALTLNAIALLVDWFSFPLVFAFLAPPFGLGARYVPFIVARNWASVIIGAMVGLLHALHILGALPSAVMPFALIVATAVALRFSYVIVRTTLVVSVAMALPIVILDLLLSLVVWSVFDRFT
jgi:hypothetical protein